MQEDNEGNELASSALHSVHRVHSVHNVHRVHRAQCAVSSVQCAEFRVSGCGRKAKLAERRNLGQRHVHRLLPAGNSFFFIESERKIKVGKQKSQQRRKERLDLV